MSVSNIAKADPSLANRYLADQVTDQERETIESDLMEDPEFLRELEATARFKVGLQRLRETGRLDELVASRAGAARLRFAAVAAVAIAIVGAIAFVRIGGREIALAPTLADLSQTATSTLPLASTHALFRRRAPEFDTVIELPDERAAIAIRMLPDLASQTPPYEVLLESVRDDAHEEVARLQGLRPDADGFVTVYADSKLLHPGAHRLTITGTPLESTSSHSESFNIRVASP